MTFLFSLRRRRARERQSAAQSANFRPAYEAKPNSPEALLADTLLRTALDLGADEFRLTPTQDGPRLSMGRRVNEVWRHPVQEAEDAMTLPSHLRRGLTVRFKELAELDLLVTQRFQHGRFPLYYYDRQMAAVIDVSVEPGTYGEEIRVSLAREETLQ